MTDTLNPFYFWPASEVVPSGELVGREQIIEQLVHRLPGRSVIMASPRRTGKTSVAREALRHLDGEGFVTASLDFFRIQTKRQCAEVLTKQLLEHTHSFGARVRELGAAVRRAATEIEPHATIAEIEFGIGLRGETDESKLFEQALLLPERLAERLDRGVVILMDEFQEADRSLGPDVYQIMRSHFQEQPRTHHLFAGSRATLLRKLFSSPKAALYRHAIEVELPFPTVDVWAEYIVRKFSEAQMHCPVALAEALVAETGGHPADTMEFCQQLHEVVNWSRGHAVSPDHLAVAREQAKRVLSGVFDEVWLDIGDTRYARRVAQLVAEGKPPRARQLPAQVSGDALDSLVAKGILRHAGSRYSFVEPFFEDYVRTKQG